MRARVSKEEAVRLGPHGSRRAARSAAVLIMRSKKVARGSDRPERALKAGFGRMESEIVMTGLVPVIHVLLAARKTWMRRTSPRKTDTNEGDSGGDRRSALLQTNP